MARWASRASPDERSDIGLAAAPRSAHRSYTAGYGYAYASDTGSAIKGLRIDLAVKDKYEEARFNRYDVPVYILEKAKTW